MRALPLDILGATTVIDPVVERVQRVLVTLAAKDPAFKALAEATAPPHTNAWGVLGPTTKKALAVFNKMYGWDDGPILSAGTLAALDRPDVKDPNRAPDASAADQASAVATLSQTAAATATTPAQVQAAAVQLTAAVKTAPPEVQAAVAAAQNAAAVAVTPAQVETAKTQIAQAAERVRAAGEEKFNNPLVREYGGVPLYGWLGLGAGGVTLAALLVKFLFGQRTS